MDDDASPVVSYVVFCFRRDSMFRLAVSFCCGLGKARFDVAQPEVQFKVNLDEICLYMQVKVIRPAEDDGPMVVLEGAIRTDSSVGFPAPYPTSSLWP